MLRNLSGVLLAGMLIASTGCLAISAKNNRFGSDREVVAVNGRVYLIDVKSGAVRELDLAAARPFEPGSKSDDGGDD